MKTVEPFKVQSYESVNDLILSSSNWDDFFDRVSAQDETKDKGDVFERFTQLYLQTATNIFRY